MSWFGMHLCSGVTVRYDFGTTGEKKKSAMLCFFSFILNTVVQIKLLYLDVKITIINTNTITLCTKSVLFSF